MMHTEAVENGYKYVLFQISWDVKQISIFLSFFMLSPASVNTDILAFSPDKLETGSLIYTVQLSEACGDRRQC